MRPLPARASANRELVEPHRQPRFQNLRVGEAAVGHVRLHRAGAVMVRPGSRPAGDRLVILVPLVAEGEVVHRPLTWREPAGRREQGVGDHLAGLDIAGDNRGGIAGIEHRAFGNDQSDRAEAAVVHRDRVVDQCSHNV